MKYSFFEMYHLMEAQGGGAGHIPDERDSYFMPSDQTDSMGQQYKSRQQNQQAMDDLFAKAFQKGNVQKATPQPPSVGNQPTITKSGEDPESLLPRWARKHNSRASDKDIKKSVDPEIADKVIQDRRRRQSASRLSDQLTDFNDKWSRSRGYHDFALQELKNLGYDVPDFDFPNSRLRLSLTPTGQEGEVVVNPEDAQKIMKYASDMMSSRRDDADESVPYQGNFRDDLSKDTKSAEEYVTNQLAKKIDSLFTKDQKSGGKLYMNEPVGIGKFIQNLSQDTGRKPEEVQAALKKLFQVAPFLFNYNKETGMISAAPQGKQDTEDQEVFSKTGPIKQVSGQNQYTKPIPKDVEGESTPESEFKSKMNELKPMLDGAVTGKVSSDKAYQALEALEKALRGHEEEDWAQEAANELGGYLDELEGMSNNEWTDMDVWVQMDNLIESHTLRY